MPLAPTLALRSLLLRPLSLALSLAAVALSIALMLVLAGLERGVRRQVTAYLEHAPGSLVVAQTGIDAFFASSSVLPEGAESATRALPGVVAAAPILTQAMYLDLHEKQVFVFLIGYRPSDATGPVRMTAGREPRARFEVVIDEALAREHGIEVGESLRIGLLAFPVVGLSSGSSTWLATNAFTTLDTVRTLMRRPDLTSFLLITPTSDTDVEAIREDLRRTTDATVLTKDRLMAGDLALFAPFFAPARLMVGVAFAVGTMMIALVTYTDAIERRREHGTLKAIGAPMSYLYRLAIGRGLAVTMFGTLLGSALAFAASGWIPAVRPQVVVALTPPLFAAALLAGAAMSALATLAPIRMIANLAPSDAFRGRAA